ncbi:hypothetical protein C7N83_08045, partial [Neisseria iguanae]
MRKFKKKVSALPLDNGRGFYRHKKFAGKPGVKTGFGRLSHPWGKGLVANTGGLLQQSFPKQTDFNLMTDRNRKGGWQTHLPTGKNATEKNACLGTPGNRFLDVFNRCCTWQVN